MRILHLKNVSLPQPLTHAGVNPIAMCVSLAFKRILQALTRNSKHLKSWKIYSYSCTEVGKFDGKFQAVSFRERGDHLHRLSLNHV